jgi:hypothetical protein
MASEYTNWAAAYGRKNPNATNEDRRDAYWGWRAKKGRPVPGSPQAAQQAPEQSAAAAPAPPPEYDPNYRDAAAEQDLANVQQKYDTQRVNASTEYSNYLNKTFGAGSVESYDEGGVKRYRLKQGADPEQYGGVFAQMRQDRERGITNRQNSAASSGMLRSGNRIVQEGQVKQDYANRATDIEGGRRDAATGEQTAFSNAATGQQTERYNALRDAGQRRMNTYRQNWGV